MREVAKVPVDVAVIMGSVLTFKQLVVAVGHYMEGKSKWEIAKDLGVCPRRVLFLKKKARKELKAALPASQYRLLRQNRIGLINKKLGHREVIL